MNRLIYIAAFLLPLDNFPFMFGGGYKPVSLIFIALYLMMNLFSVFKAKYKTSEIYVLLVMITFVLVTFFQNRYYQYENTGLIDACLTIASGTVIYLSFKIFVARHEDPGAYIKLFKCMVYGYGIAVGIGLLQLIYIYVLHIGIIAKFVGLFVSRTGFISTARVHFTFSEPSYIALHTNLLLIPAFIALKRANQLNWIINSIVIGLFIVSLFSFSLRYYMDSIILLLVFLFLYTKRIVKLSVITTFSLASLYCVLYLVFVINVFSINADHFGRIGSFLKNPAAINQDESFSIRSTFSKVAMDSFKEKPILGYGLGNFYYGYKENYSEIVDLSSIKQKELRDADKDKTLHQYNMYTRVLSEMGLMGILLVVPLLYFVFHQPKRSYLKMVLILLAWSQLQFDSFALIQIYFWLALMQHPFIASLELREAVQSQTSPVQTQVQRPLKSPVIAETTLHYR
ncbi:O-antigen ligase family protein [Paenibacillus sedimenti]|uniref:O-antigen ligase family protein n=1 Tax=Paenibacillus sedimenti TaxID=2770274 RepID=A0A926QHP8_9BACL|nr:O-antigen ligase family protein [Paenibacillus sedimenti]MBD0379781.1 O-antigen ligase family protein [Paenibacillus sedimenti]